MYLVIALTGLGPVVGCLGWALGWGWLYWVGVAICALALLADIGSGAMKLPVLPVALMALASGFFSPWWLGASIGLIAWTTIDAAGMLVNRFRLARRQVDP